LVQYAFSFSVVREKSTAVNNAKNTFETEFQRRMAEVENNFRREQVSNMPFIAPTREY
jgi:hypothetical protein